MMPRTNKYALGKNCIVTPGSIVRVTDSSIRVGLVTTYVRPDSRVRLVLISASSGSPASAGVGAGTGKGVAVGVGNGVGVR